jgi:hypothetical protein
MPVILGKTQVGTESVPDIITIKDKSPAAGLAAGLMQFFFYGMSDS